MGAPVGIASASVTLIFSLMAGIIKKLLSIIRNKKKKHDKIFMLAKSKLNSIETLVSQALIDMEISHEELATILNERDKYEKIKENLKNISEKQENMRLNSVNSKTQKITILLIIYATGDFNWLKTREVNNKLRKKKPKLLNIYAIKKLNFF